MATYGPADASVSIAASTVPNVTVIGDIEKMAITEEITPLGVANETFGYVGVKSMSPVTLEAPYTTTSGDLAPVGDAAGIGATLAIIITIGGSKTVAFSSIVTNIKRTIARGAYTKYILTLQPTGAVTEV